VPVLDELVHEPGPGLGPVADAVFKVVSVPPSPSVVPAPTRVSLAVLS
jgi:hypothetical protein